jgi:transposase
MTVMDETGRICGQGQVSNQPEEIRDFLTQFGVNGKGAAVLEASRNWTVKHDWLEKMVDEVHLAHPLKVKAIAEAKIKTDKIDAKVLAHLYAVTFYLKPMCRLRQLGRQGMFSGRGCSLSG